MAIDFLERNEQYKYIIEQNFKLIKFKSNGEPILGHLPPDERKRIPKEINHLRAELNQKSDQEIYDLHKHLKSKETEKEKSQQAKKAEFVDLPETKADFVHWGKQSFWSIHECAALCLGKEPRVVTCERISHLVFTGHKFIQQYTNLANILRREFDRPDDLSKYQGTVRTIYQSPANLNRPHVEIAADFLIEWADSNGITIPDKLINAVEKIKKRKLTTKTLLNQVKELEQQLQDSKISAEGVHLKEIHEADCLTHEMLYMLKASIEFWVPLYNKPDIQAHKNTKIEEWLKSKNIDPTPAKHIATLIRPEWAKGAGRPSEE